MRIAICDQNDMETKKLKIALYAYSNLQKMELLVDCFRQGEQLLCSSAKYNLVFIDYALSGMNGLQTAKAVKKASPDSTIIFLSATTGGFILNSFEVSPFRFLLKPVNQKLLFETLQDYFQTPDLKRPLWIKNGVDTICMNTGDILYLEADNKHCVIGLRDRKVPCRKTMAAVYDNLPKRHFCKINRAYVVNFSYIEGYNKNLIRLKNGESLYISRTYYKSFQQEYRSFADPVEL